MKKKNNRNDLIQLITGICLLLIPLAFLIIKPELYDRASLVLRVITALGGGLVGSSLTGMLEVNLPFAKASGAFGMFLLIYAVNPPKETLHSFAPDTPQEAILSDMVEFSHSISVVNGDNIFITEQNLDSIVINNQEVSYDVLISAEERLEIVMPLSWVKPNDWLGRKYHLAIDDGVYLWPTSLDGSLRQADIIINNSNRDRDTIEKIIDNVTLEVGDSIRFNANEKAYLLTLNEIKNAGRRSTLAGYFTAYLIYE